MQGFDLAALLTNPEYRGLLAHGVVMTFAIFALSWLLAMGLGMALLALRRTGARPVEAAVALYISYHRNVPTLVQLMLWYFGIASLLPDAVQEWLSDHQAEAFFAILSLGLCQAAYFTEDLRSGLRGIGPGQAEAGRALGLRPLAIMRLIILPQAFRNALQALVNHSVSLFKNSSLAMAIGVAELTHAVKEIENQSFRTFEIFLIGTVLYLLFSLALMGLGAALEGRAKLAGAR